MIRVIGVGTRRGDDAAGLEAVGELSRRPLPAGVELRTCERPGPELVDALAGADAVVLVDATRPDGAPGSVRRLTVEALRRSETLSTHAFGVAECLALADALGRLPERVELVGIEAARTDASPGEAPSRAVREGIAEAVAMTGALVDELCGAAAGRT